MASPGLSELTTLTFEAVMEGLADNVGNHIAGLKHLREKGREKTYDGGEYIRENLAYTENGTYTRYSGWEPIDITNKQTITSARFNPKQAAVTISFSGREELEVRGKAEILDLIESRSMVAEKTFLNNLSQDFYSSGTADGGRQINGLQSIVADTPGSGIVGGINAATFSFWQNFAFDATTDGGAAADVTNIQDYMLSTYLSVVRGADKPDVVLSDNNYFKLYHNSLVAMQRIAQVKKADTGSLELDYMGIPVVFDGGKGGSCPTNHMYFLNLDYLAFVSHSARNFKQIGADRYSLNQDGTVRIIGWMGNMTSSNRSLQAVLKD